MSTNPPLNHLAIIMDGNGRWAKARGLQRLDGHKAGVEALRVVAKECGRLGIRYLTVFGFSTENWQRSPREVSGLMDLFKQYLDAELDTFNEHGIRVRAIGDLERLPFFVRSALRRDIERTKDNDRFNLILAMSYGGREEIVHAARELAAQAAKGKLDPDKIDNSLFASCLWTGEGIPDPDLLIRTSGEMRISNFLLWQLAYSEIVVTPEYWPDFNEETLARCVQEYETRERRFGLTSEQLKNRTAASDPAAPLAGAATGAT